MPEYRIRLTKTETHAYTVEKTVEIPTDDPAKALVYAEVAAGFDQYDSKSLLRHAAWGSPEAIETIHCEVLGTDPDFEEVPAAAVRLEQPAIAYAELEEAASDDIAF